jgi:hypothetical protein
VKAYYNLTSFASEELLRDYGFLLKLLSLYILWLIRLLEVALVKPHVGKIGLGIVVVLAVLFSACLASPELKGNKPPVISSLEAEYINVYPGGASQIKCVASDPEGDAVQFKWSSTGGSIKSDGPIVTWEAPNDYGDYHIMVVAQDGNGSSAQATLTVSVVPRPVRSCCGR